MEVGATFFSIQSVGSSLESPRTGFSVSDDLYSNLDHDTHINRKIYLTFMTLESRVLIRVKIFVENWW